MLENPVFMRLHGYLLAEAVALVDYSAIVRESAQTSTGAMTSSAEVVRHFPSTSVQNHCLLIVNLQVDNSNATWHSTNSPISNLNPL